MTTKDFDETTPCPMCGNSMEEGLTYPEYFCSECLMYFEIDDGDPDPDEKLGGAHYDD